jgi:hypothetical protein
MKKKSWFKIILIIKKNRLGGFFISEEINGNPA